MTTGDRGDGIDSTGPGVAVADAKAELGAAETLASDGASSGGHSPPAAAASSASGAASSSTAVAVAVVIRGVGPGDRLGRYELADELGAGGMASVLRARDTELRRDVAVKVLFPHLAKKVDITRRFQREARAAAVLEHPNILRVYDVGAAPGTPPFIVMELVRGHSLREVAEAHGAMLAELVACIGALMCDALAVAHAAGIIHRDVKPGNVMLADDGRLLLADFGVARLDDDDSLVTKSGAMLGTPSFMAPEQALGNPVDGRADLYSVGASLYQLATGVLPYSGPTAKVVADASRGGATPAMRRRPAVGSELSRFIERLMAPEPARRPATAAAAAAALRVLVAAAGLGEPADEVRAFALDRAGWDAARRPLVVARLVERARAARRGSLALALALIDRALAIAPEHAEAQALAAELQAPAARRWLVALVGVAAVGFAGAGAWMLVRGSPAGPRDEGLLALAVDAGPAAAAVDAAGQLERSGTSVVDAGPLAADAALGAPHLDARGLDGRGRDGGAGRVVADAATPSTLPIDAAVAADAAPASPADAGAPAPAPARVTFSFDTWCDLVVDDELRGRADRTREVSLAPGRHRASCSQGPGLGVWSESVEVAAGEVRRIDGTLLRPVEVTIEAGDSVRIGGQTVARGDAVVLRPGRYRVEVIAGGKARPAAYVNIPRIRRCTLRDQPTLDCYQ